jgi:hypothetical protein
MISKEHHDELCSMSKCRHIMCNGDSVPHSQFCFAWEDIDPFRRKILELKYTRKEKNERNSIK